MNIDQDIKDLIWGYKTFQQCVPEQYRTDIGILVGKYYTSHPTDEMIEKITTLHGKFVTSKNTNEKNYKKYIKEHYND